MNKLTKHIPIIITERLFLQKISLKDDAFILALVNSPNWLEFIGDRGIKTLEHARTYIQQHLIYSYKINGYGLYKISLKQNKTPIGICGFLKRNYLKHEDLGFAILPMYEGKGYTYEASKKMLFYGQTQLKLNVILAITSKENIKSKKLLLKLGFIEKQKIKPNKDEKELLMYTIQTKN